MGATLTHAVTGRQFPFTAFACELGDSSFHALGLHLPGLTMADKKSWKNRGVLGGVGNGVAEKDSHQDLNPGAVAVMWV